MVDRIDEILPQTQCEKCGYAGCRPYAEALVKGDDINKCPPGGNETILALSKLLSTPFLALNPKHGKITTQKVAYIIEDQCIGCMKCIKVCPMDAIIGAPKLMHTVITGDCSGCDLCIDPCPVDCIKMQEVKNDATISISNQTIDAKHSQSYRWKTLHAKRQTRLANEAIKNTNKETTIKEANFSRTDARKEIKDAIERTLQKRKIAQDIKLNQHNP